MTDLPSQFPVSLLRQGFGGQASFKHPASSALPSLSVCVPALNEEHSLRGAVEDLLATLVPVVSQLDVIVVNDGSTDGTGCVADELAEAHACVRVLHHAQNAGLGASIRNALAVAREDWFVYFPADHENSALELAQAVAHVEPECLVTTHHLSSDPRPFRRRWISKTYTGILNLLFGLRLKYYNGLTLHPTAAMRQVPLVASGYLCNAEVMIRMLKRGYRVKELEYPLRKRDSGKSTALRLRTFVCLAEDCVRVWRAGGSVRSDRSTVNSDMKHETGAG